MDSLPELRIRGFYGRVKSNHGVGLRKNEIPGRENDFLRGKLTEVRLVKFL